MSVSRTTLILDWLLLPLSILVWGMITAGVALFGFAGAVYLVLLYGC